MDRNSAVVHSAQILCPFHTDQIRESNVYLRSWLPAAACAVRGSSRIPHVLCARLHVSERSDRRLSASTPAPP
jgi:hypothetical protein